MMKSSQLTEISVTLQPGEIKPFKISGVRVICQENNGGDRDLRCALEGYTEVALPKGMKLIAGADEEFSGGYLKNTGATAISIVVLVGYGDVVDARVNVTASTILVTQAQEPATTSSGAAATPSSLAENASVNIAATSGGKNLRAFVVANLEKTVAEGGSGRILYIMKGANIYCPVRPGETVSPPVVGEAMSIKNLSGSGGPISYTLGLSYYA